MADTNIQRMIAEMKEEILEKLRELKEHTERLEEAVNDPEIQTRGVGIGWVTNVERPLDGIRFRVAQIDALACVHVYPEPVKKRAKKKG